MKRTSTLRRMLGTGLGAVVLGATVVAMAAPAGAADAPGATGGARRARVHLTAEQKQCLADHGVTPPVKPADGTRPTPPTDAQREAFRAAATACGLPTPPARPSI